MKMEHVTAGSEWQTSMLKMAVLWTLFSVSVPHCMTAVCNELFGEGNEFISRSHAAFKGRKHCLFKNCQDLAL